MDYISSWKQSSLKEKFQVVNGTLLIVSAIVLYFLSFILTYTIGVGIISACASMFGTALALFGITSYVKTSMIDLQTEVKEKLKKLEELEKKNKKDDE